jgi:AsmA protein
MTGRPSSGPRDIWQQGQFGGLRSETRTGRATSQAGRRTPRAQRRWLAVAGYGALTLACLCLAAVAFLIFAAPLDAVRDRLVEQVSARTGRTLVIAGPASLSLYPRLAVSVRDVSVLAPEGMGAAPVVSVPSLEVEVSLWSLLSRRPQLGGVTLRRPTIELSIDAQGRRNWELSRPGQVLSGPVDGGREAQAPAKLAPPAGQNQAKGLQRPAGSVRIIDGTLRYRDERSGSHDEISALDLILTTNDLDGPVAVSGTFTRRGTQAGFAAVALPLRSILADQPVHLTLKVGAAGIEAAYEGTMAFKGGIAADGKVSIRAPSAQALSHWLGTPWPSAADPLAISGHVKAVDGGVMLSSLEASLGDVSLEGSLAVGVKGRPSVSGKLRISELDIGKLPALSGKRADGSAVPPVPAAAPEPDKRASRKGWSDHAIDPQVLAVADADLALSVGRLLYKDVKIGQSTVSLSVKDGLAKVMLEDVELYDGRAQGEIALDGTGGTLTLGTPLKLAGVSILPLLRDAAGVGWLEGRGTIALVLNGRGLSQRQIVQSLNGKVDVAVADGALIGIDVGKLLRAIERGRLPNLAPASEDRTPFSQLAGTFDLADGTAKNRDLKLAGTHLWLQGEGMIDLGPRQIDYTLRTKIAGGPPAEGAAVRIGTLEIPIGIKGPLERPEFTIKGYEELTGTLKQIGKNLRSREMQDAIKGLLSGDRDKRVKPQELIDKLLKKE